MRYDDPSRPQQGGVRLQVSGAPLPVITLIAPGESEGTWLACIQAQRASNRFGYHSGVVRLSEFATAYLADPEAALARYFQYFGPEEEPAKGHSSAPAIGDLWED